MDTGLRKTPLHSAHLALGARMVEFAGWDMPVLYGGILEEARAVRHRSGIFDISHMGRFALSGEGSTARLQSITTNDVAALQPGSAHYSLLTNPNGGVIDDIIVYRHEAEYYSVVVNASNTWKDWDWMQLHNQFIEDLEDDTDKTAMIAVQGPEAPTLVAELTGNDSLLGLKRFQFVQSSLLGDWATFCRTGYTGEDGFEIIVPEENAIAVWNALIAGGAAPCGLGSRDALRIEAGYPLYGHEIDDTTTPVEAGLMWVVKMDKGPFTGREQIADVKRVGPKKRLVGLVSQERTAPRQGYNVCAGSDVIGTVTSGVFSPIRSRSVAMAYVASEYAAPGTSVEVEIRGKRSAMTVVPKKALLES